jgi:hypothetical protein
MTHGPKSTAKQLTEIFAHTFLGLVGHCPMPQEQPVQHCQHGKKIHTIQWQQVCSKFKYSLLIRYSFILGSQNVDFWAEITNPPKVNKLPKKGNFMYHRFLQTARLATKKSNINNEYQTLQAVANKTGLL